MALSQFKVPASSSWKEVEEKKKGSINVLWYEIEPFLYKNDKGEMIGVEYELMEGFKTFLQNKYQIELNINWIDADAFDKILPYIETSSDKGLFGMSFYSITEERKAKVKFSPPYMPDLNIIVTNNNLPVYENDEQMIKALPGLKAFTMKETTMQSDIEFIKKNYFPALPISYNFGDYEIIRQISNEKNSFGYVPVTIYVTALQRGVKVKRQRVLAVRREGFAAIFPKGSDWDEPINEYIKSEETKLLVTKLIRKYLGGEVANIILNISASEIIEGTPTDIELLTKEREIVTKRLIATALEAQHNKTQRNVILLIGAGMLIIAAFAISRFRTKNRMNKLLKARNKVIASQSEKLDQLNKRLNMKILQSKLNPHFLFNSLNAIQYHVGENDKKGALQYLTHFSGFLRKVLQSGDELLIAASEEALLAEKYLWLEQNRFPGKFEYAVTVNKGAAEMDTPPMLLHSILQEVLYTNVINSVVNNYKLTINFTILNNELIISVTDNGPEKNTTETAVKTNGLQEGTMEILPMRLKLINSSAIKPVTLNYMRVGEQNVVELKITQPLFHQ